MAETTFLACSALTNKVIAELPLVNPSYTRVLNDSGSIQGDIELDDTTVRELGLIANGAVEPAAVSCYVQRNGLYVWGGLIWTHGYAGATAKMALNGAEFGSLLSLKSINSTSAAYIGELAAQLCAWVTSAFASAGCPVTTTYTATPTTITLTVLPWETHVYLDLIKSYAVAVGGVDWAFDVAVVGGVPQAQFNVSYPRRGQSYVHSGVVWDFPGDILDYNLTKDGQRIAAILIENGSGSGSQMVQAVVTQSPQGHLALDVVDSNNSLTSLADIISYGRGKLVSMAKPPIIATCSLPAEIFFSSGVTVGDEVQVATPVDDPYLQGINFPSRIIAYTVKLQTSSGIESVDVTFGDVL